MITAKQQPARPLVDPDPEGQPLLLSIRQAARLLGVGTTFTWELVRSGRLPSVRLGRRVLIPRAAIEKLARRSEVPAEHEQ